MEPITTIIVGAIAMGAAAGIKPTMEQAVKDAYARLKRLIQDRYGSNDDVVDAVDYVSKKPEASGRREALEKVLEEAGAGEDAELAGAAKQVVDAVEAHAPELAGSIGIDIGVLKAKILKVEDVLAGAGGTAVRIDRAEIAGTASFKNIGREGSNPK
jgi:hypothetical protein